jgi:hypothetical protein
MMLGAASRARAAPAPAETTEANQGTHRESTPPACAGDAPVDARDAASGSQRARDARDIGRGAGTTTDVVAAPTKRLKYTVPVVDAAKNVLRRLAKKSVPAKMKKALIEKHIGETMTIMSGMTEFPDRQHLFTGDNDDGALRPAEPLHRRQRAQVDARLRGRQRVDSGGLHDRLGVP